MNLTPSQAIDEMRLALTGYLEAAYKISHPAVVAERAYLIRQAGVLSQAPFVESTPAFPDGEFLAQLEHDFPDLVPVGLSKLVQHGVPVDRFKLWLHQQKALLASQGSNPHILVATGTGSGKTESFLLPILADLMREAANWSAPKATEKRGYVDATGQWIHSRSHETRPAALRAIVLYPMNALVNDQLSRLRRILARGDSPEWQHHTLNGNEIHFGMYTSLAPTAGHWSNAGKVKQIRDFFTEIESSWNTLSKELQESGSWPRPSSPEMLVRWDMQLAPPDILVTNYSMLEYMLVRPEESRIFDLTRQWLSENDTARFSLVLDEAHTYTGAKGTEVAYLIRRLKERLGISQGSMKFRAIATTASLPPGRKSDLRKFAADLFDERIERFSLIELEGIEPHDPNRVPVQRNLDAFARFQTTFSLANPWPAIKVLASDLEFGEVDEASDPQVALFKLLSENGDVKWVRQRTARKATPFKTLANELWQGLDSEERRELATSGVLAAGSSARAIARNDMPPLLSMRLHAFFRGIPGYWACMDPKCPMVRHDFQTDNRPVGKLYLEARPWCDCGARVLELFSCRKCGLLYLGGIPDTHEGSLWPWSDDLSGERADTNNFQIFGVESPFVGAIPVYRSTKSTLSVHENDSFARAVFEVESTRKPGESAISFPDKCPRCSHNKGPGREIIEDLRTKGQRPFAAVVEAAYRTQPHSATKSPNYGRKALLFADSRKEAAKLAADIRQIHHGDLFRQLLVRALYRCATCDGTGRLTAKPDSYVLGQEYKFEQIACHVCDGSGHIQNPEPINFKDLRDRVIALQFERAIDPTGDSVRGFFEAYKNGDAQVQQWATEAFSIAIRRELSEEEFGLEPLGLGGWRIPERRLDSAKGQFDPLTREETKQLLQNTARILATENILLPPSPYKPWEWPKDQLKDYHKKSVVFGSTKERNIISFDMTQRRKLGRYIRAVADTLLADGRLSDNAAKEIWISKLRKDLWNALKALNVLVTARHVDSEDAPQGITIDTFDLIPITESVDRCTACGYIMASALLRICARCGHQTRRVPADKIDNYYRRNALLAGPCSTYDDPYPLRAIEHSAQIETPEARDEERWFQDLFRDNQDPDDHRIDILSVTTTMEMGIDIGSLLGVGLRNVPPTVANYQQRAGRAGRRGSAVSTVITYAQARSHDQYYFEHPPEIVSNPPRVPTLHLKNEVIAHRHVRTLVLQEYFSKRLKLAGKRTSFMAAWGTVKEFIQNNHRERLQTFIRENEKELVERATIIVGEEFVQHVTSWITAIVDDIEGIIYDRDEKDELLDALATSGLLPRYAFPVDVVSLSTPNSSKARRFNSSPNEEDRMGRDLRIAIGEYAPGAEVVKGRFPNTYKYRIAGIYDAFEPDPNYGPTGQIMECQNCQAIDVLSLDDEQPDICPECLSMDIAFYPYLRPKGFTVDHADPYAEQRYEGDGLEKSGTAMPARLKAGRSSFTHDGALQADISRSLYAMGRVGNLFVSNIGPDRDTPGFLICPDCGRYFPEGEAQTHKHPSNVPPHFGTRRGPRAGHVCRNRRAHWDPVVLGHQFRSELLLLGVDLPPEMDAPFQSVAGKAVWNSFGTLVKNAATLTLQINPEELAVGVRPARRTSERILGEVFLYDDVPGGAGYARAIKANLKTILQSAADIGHTCTNPQCTGACYSCLFDYRNQFLHPFLHRELGLSILQYILNGQLPSVSEERASAATEFLKDFVAVGWKLHGPRELNNRHVVCVFETTEKQKYGLHVIHPAQARPTSDEALAIFAAHGIRLATHTIFDIERRPFWVMNNLLAK